MIDNRIKIGFFNCYYPEISGGSEYQTYLLAKSLDKSVFDPFFISLSTCNHGYKEVNGDRVYFFKPKGRLAKIDKGYLSNILFINHVIRREGPKIIYQRMANSATGILGLLSKIHGFKFIWACASQEDISPLRFRVRNPVTWIENILRSYGIRHATKIILQSNDQQASLKQRFNLDGVILKNGHPEPKEISTGYIFPLNIVFVGNFKRIKQPEIFIRLAEYLRNRQGIKFTMVGRISDDAYAYSITKKLSEIGNIDWLGELSQYQVNSLLAKAYVLVNTSEYEGFSNTFVQAWQRSVPVLSLNVDPDKLLSEGGLGLFSGSFEKLCKDLEFLLDNSNVRNEMGERGCQYVVKEHSLSVISDRFKMILAEVMNG